MVMKTVTILAFISIWTISTSLFFFNAKSSPKSFYHTQFLSLSDNTSAANHLFTLTRRPHVAGTQANAEAASYVLSTLISNQIPSHLASYEVSLSYPVSRSLTLSVTDPSSSSSSYKEFSLRQEIYDGDPYADVANEVLPTFHAYAKSGLATGPAVYANYGRVQDFATLKEMGVNVSGNVVLARYGEIYRGDIVHNAQEAGAIGVIVYTDRKDYGGGGGDKRWFPEDKWMPPSGVQVGSVFTGTGDPTTTGWPSIEGCERLSAEEVEKTGDVPLIPSLPVSWADGEIIMRSIDGPVANGDWQGGGGDSPVYRVGPGPGIINLNYQGKEVIRTIQNVIGMIEGAEEPDRYVILGNHRDAWTFGAVDPNSGTAAMLEVAERLGKLQKRGWRPRRTIVFCNWDAEEYGLIGSTEWVEENREILSSRAVAYLNVDSAVYGKGFYVSATPQLDELLVEASKLVRDPDNSSQTVYDSWIDSESKAVLGRLGGAGSDYSAFVQHIGVPAADIAFGEGYPVYHSMYDDFVWMKNFGDPMFNRHVAVASVWGLVALRLADEEILPFNYLHYVDELQKSAEELQVELAGKDINLKPLFNSINGLKLAAIKINDQKEVYWKRNTKRDSQKLRELNDRLMMAERAFTDRDGLPSRPWYKHLIYAPSKHNDYGSKSFPGIDDAIEMAKDLNTEELWKSVQHEVWRVSRAIKHASLVLNGELT